MRGVGDGPRVPTMNLTVAICCNTLNSSDSVSIRKINLKFGAVTSSKDTYQIPKNQISVAGSLSNRVCIKNLFSKSCNTEYEILHEFNLDLCLFLYSMS